MLILCWLFPLLEKNDAVNRANHFQDITENQTKLTLPAHKQTLLSNTQYEEEDNKLIRRRSRKIAR